MNEEKMNAFVEQAMGDLKGGLVLLMANLGDRLGLFRPLVECWLTSEELARETGTNERYVREWLSSLACAGYVSYDADGERFMLPQEHAQVLAEEKSPVFFGGLYQEMPALWKVLQPLSKKFRDGGGLSIDDYAEEWWDGMERFTGTWFENFLLQEWVPQANGIKQKLEEGAHVADIGCGRGHALIKLASAFPNMSGVGYDLSDTNLEGARRHAEAAGVADRLTFRKQDVHDGLRERSDVAMTFDAVHDFKDPAQAFRAIYDGLEDDGAYLLLEFRVADQLRDNQGPIGAMFYAWSTCYCMTTSLGMNGAGLGTCGLPESVVKEMATQAGFASVDVVPFDNPFNKVYVARK